MQPLIDSLNIQGKSVPLVKYGNGSIPCLFIGPGSLYFDSLNKLTEIFTFYDADRYFAYPVDGNKISEDEIKNITFETYLEYYEEVRKALKLEKVAVLGPSAVGLVAHAFGEKYPNHTSHVIMLGTPSTIENLPKRQVFFMEGNYGPKRFDEDAKLQIDLTTEWSLKKWDRFQEGQKKFAEQKGKLTADESLIQELVADQEKYSIEPETEEVLRARWNRFNTTMRAHFFGNEKMTVGLKMGEKENFTVPTLAVGSLYDGVAPYYDLVDKIKNRDIYGKIYYVILEEGHSPQKVQNFAVTIKNWLDWVATHPDETGNEKWLDSLNKQFIEKEKIQQNSEIATEITEGTSSSKGFSS